MAKTLRLGREQVVPLMFTLAPLGYWTALHLGDTGLEDVKGRGRVQVGKIADLTLDKYTIPVETIHVDDTGAGAALKKKN